MGWVALLVLGVGSSPEVQPSLEPQIVPAAARAPRLAVQVVTLPGLAPMDPDELMRALALRVHSSGLEVVAAQEAGPGDFIVLVTVESRRVQASIRPPSGEPMVLSPVATQSRAGADLIHAVVLRLLAALAPIFPALDGTPPREEVPAAAPAEPTQPLPATPFMTFDAAGWVAGASVAEVSGAKLGGGATLRAMRGPLVLELDLALFSGPQRHDASYSVHVTHGTARVAVGLETHVGPVRVAGTLGPALRYYRLTGRGVGVALPAWPSSDAAVAAGLAARQPIGPVCLVLFAEALAAWRYPRFVVDGVRVLTLGRTAVTLGAGVSYAFGG